MVVGKLIYVVCIVVDWGFVFVFIKVRAVVMLGCFPFFLSLLQGRQWPG